MLQKWPNSWNNASSSSGFVIPILLRSVSPRAATKGTVLGMARYGIEAKHAFGVPMGTLLKPKKELGKDHTLATALWDTGWYEARLLAALVGDPERVTRRHQARRLRPDGVPGPPRQGRS